MNRTEKIELKIEGMAGKRESLPAIAFFFLTAGVCGSLSCLPVLLAQAVEALAGGMLQGNLLETILVEGWAEGGLFLYGTAILSCALLWFGFFQEKRSGLCRRGLFSISVLLLTGVSLLAVFFLPDGIGLNVGLAVLVTISFFLLEIVLSCHIILYLFTFLLLLFSPMFGVRPGLGTVCLLLLFQHSFFVLRRGNGRRRLELVAAEKQSRISGKSVLRLLLLLLCCSLLAVPLAMFGEEGFYDLVYQVEGYAHRTMRRIYGEEGRPVSGGKISTGNRYQMGSSHLKLTLSEKPTEPLYLRGFTGIEYTGGRWIWANERELFPDLMEELQWAQKWEYMVAGMYYNLYFTMNSNMQGEESKNPYRLLVTYTNQAYRDTYYGYYRPYYCQYSGGEYEKEAEEGYMFEYYERKDMKIRWDNISEDFTLIRDCFYQIQEAYRIVAERVYTQVPTERLPRLTKLEAENPLDSLEEISAFILYTLHSRASYTLTPGRAPLHEDITEYFLFDSGRGFCEHFAATATLLYRLYGVPARYATGYLVEPSAFTRQEDGSWQAIVTDEAAHAWTEILLEDYGWTPVEVTPASDGSTVASYPGFDAAVLSDLVQKRGWDRKEISLFSGSEKGEDSSLRDWLGGFGGLAELDLGKHQNTLLVAGACFLYSILLLPVFLDYRRLLIQKKLAASGCRVIFARFLQMLESVHALTGYQGGEEDFAKRLMTELTEKNVAKASGEDQIEKQISEKELLRLQEIVSKAAYSQEVPDREEEAYVYAVYVQVASLLYQTLNWRQKLWFRYVKAFG